jgi:hypothetical protein
MCHLNVIELTGVAVACATCGCRGELQPDLTVSWTDRDTSVLSMAEKRAHAAEIQETAARHRGLQDRIASRARTVPVIEPVAPR